MTVDFETLLTIIYVLVDDWLLAATLFDQPLAELNDQEFGATEKRPRRAS